MAVEVFQTQVADTQLGPILLAASTGRLTALRFIGSSTASAVRAELGALYGVAVVEGSHPVLRRAKSELAGYFEQRRLTFTLPLELRGTPFQRRVWETLVSVPYGSTISYSELARRVGRPRAVRAAANACGRNPLPVIIPCHRVITVDGGLGGYTGGLAVKKRLLSLERSDAQDLPLFRVVTPLDAAPLPIADNVSAGLLSALDEASSRPDEWAGQVIESLPAALWPEMAAAVLSRDVKHGAAIAAELLEAWAVDVNNRWPEPRALERFLVVSAGQELPWFEVVARRLAAAAGLPESIERTLRHVYQELMANALPALPRHRELSVDMWLALDPKGHGALLKRAREGKHDTA